MNPGLYSLGIGDRFGHEGKAQMEAINKAAEQGIAITPVWNKSNREHSITGTMPLQVRAEADEAVRTSGYRGPYFVDADHIGADTVTKYLEHCDWFTIDVASSIGAACTEQSATMFLKEAHRYIGDLKIDGIARPYIITPSYLDHIASNYLAATKKAADIYRVIEASKGAGNFVTEISMDEVSVPQRPADIFFILMMLSMENVPVQTIAPKFSGSFHKGVDYMGDISLFSAEFESDLLVIDRAIRDFSLPEELKISVHSGSDKFSIYPHIGNIIRKHGKGIHIKTAGTTWLEEVIGLALGGGDSLAFIRHLCIEALKRREELSAPYAGVTDIDASLLPDAATIEEWTGTRLAGSLRHNSNNADYNPSFRQLIHLAYKIAAENRVEFEGYLNQHHTTVSGCVCENLYDRHIKSIFNL